MRPWKRSVQGVSKVYTPYSLRVDTSRRAPSVLPSCWPKVCLANKKGNSPQDNYSLEAKVEARARFRIGLLFTILGLLSLFSSPGRLAAQLDRGEVTGTAQDPSGAVVAGVKIVLTNDATNVSATTRS